MNILPKLRTRYGEAVGVEIFIQPPDINENETTFINTDVASGVSSLTVDNGSKFSTSEYVAILPGNFGSEKAEIIKLHASTTPTTTTLTLASATGLAHNRGERVVFIPYNQIKIERSTDAGLNYSALATVDIRPDSTETMYADTSGLSSYYYRVKFYNSASTNSSAVSDGILATGFSDNSAGLIFRSALLSLGEKIDGEVLTKEFLLQALHEGREEADGHALIHRWSFRVINDYDFGDIIPGRYTIAAPTDLRDPDTYKNILSLRLGRDGRALVPCDTIKMNGFYEGIAHSTLNGSITGASTSLILTSSGDFDDSGTVDVAAESVSGTLDNVAYTGNTESSATLTGATSIADSHDSGRDVWQGANFGLPTHYTVRDGGTIVFSQPFSDDFAGENVKGDYYAELTRADSDGDVLDEPWASEVYVPYMKWRIRKRKDSSLKSEEDSDYKDYVKKLEAKVAKEFTGQDMRIQYDI